MSDTHDREDGAGGADRLADYLEQDPANPTLLVDLLDAALAEDRPDLARDVLARLEAAGPLDERATHLAGLAAMQDRDFAEAAARYTTLREAGFDDPAIRFNLAWSLAMIGRREDALGEIDSACAETLPAAAMLEVQLRHQLGRFEEAAARARSLAELHPDHQGLMAAISVLALDIEDTELAAEAAAKGGEHPDALTTRGTLALGGRAPAEALALFEAALARNAHVPRAWIGAGLAKLAAGDARAATADLDKGAEMFGSHLGSWIAAGWAQVLAGDRNTGRERFDRARALDPTFAEAHGALAALDAMDGQTERAREGTAVALRLDRDCFSAALATVLLTAAEGDGETVQRVFDRAVSQPLDADGRTLADHIVGARYQSSTTSD